MTTMTATRPVLKTRKTAKPAHGTCRLTLSINGTDYDVRPNPGAAVKAFRLRKGDGTVYDVVQAEHGLACDCPDHVFHRDGLDPAGCKHVRAMVACGLLTADRDAEAEAEAEAEAPTDAPSPAEALARIDGEINTIGRRIRGLADREINTRVHTELVKARRELMTQRDRLLARIIVPR